MTLSAILEPGLAVERRLISRISSSPALVYRNLHRQSIVYKYIILPALFVQLHLTHISIERMLLGKRTNHRLCDVIEPFTTFVSRKALRALGAYASAVPCRLGSLMKRREGLHSHSTQSKHLLLRYSKHSGIFHADLGKCGEAESFGPCCVLKPSSSYLFLGLVSPCSGRSHPLPACPQTEPGLLFVGRYLRAKIRRPLCM